MEELTRRVTELEAAIRRLETICSRMDKHITNVESVMTTLKSPANFMKQQIERVMGVKQPTPLLDFVPT